MKQTVQPDTKQAQNGPSQPARSPKPQNTFAPGGRLSELAAMMNSSPRAQALAQLKDDMQQGPRVQSLGKLAAEVNQCVPAQSQGIPISGDAGLEGGADVTRLNGPEAGQAVAQRKKAPAEVKGLTHLVKKNVESIHASAEEHEVKEPETVVVETNDRIRSRRGPNQEEFAE